MMKKKYIMPESVVYLVKAEDICGQPGVGSGDANNEGGPGGDYGDGFAKETDWEDEEDDY